MKQILAVLFVGFLGTQVAAHHDATISQDDCNDINWESLETSPETSPDYTENTAPVLVSTNLLAGSATSNKTFCYMN